MANTITGKPSSLHCGPEIQQMKLNNKWMKQVKNPNWQQADQLAIYKCSWGVEPGTTWLKSTLWSEQDLNSRSPDFKSSDLTTMPRCLPNLVPVFLITSNTEVESNCEGTLWDGYLNWHASNYLQFWTYMLLWRKIIYLFLHSLFWWPSTAFSGLLIPLCQIELLYSSVQLSYQLLLPSYPNTGMTLGKLQQKIKIIL